MEKEDGGSRLECLVSMHLAGFQRQPDLAACFQVELRQSGRFMRENVKGELQRYLDLIREIVEHGRRDGSFRSELPARLVTHLIFGTLDEVVSTWVMSGMEYNLVSLTGPLTDLFTNGIGQGVSAPALDGPVGGRNLANHHVGAAGIKETWMKLLVDERDMKFVLYEQLRMQELCKSPRLRRFFTGNIRYDPGGGWKTGRAGFLSFEQKRGRTGLPFRERAGQGPGFIPRTLPALQGRGVAGNVRLARGGRARACRLYWPTPASKCLVRPTGRSSCTPG